MKRSLHCLFLILLFAVAVHAQSVEGNWEGVLKTGTREIPLVLHVTQDGQGGLKATIDSPTQGRLGIPITTISFADSTLKFEIQQLGSYEGKVNAEGTAISGTWTQRGSPSPLDFRRAKSNTTASETVFLKRAATVGKNTFGYRVYLPENFDEKKSYPVVLYLHGANARGDDNEKQTFSGFGEVIRRNPKQFDSFIAVFPQIPVNSFWGGEMVEHAMKALEQSLADFKADPQRVYLIGTSLGGFGAWYTAAKYPDKFAALITIAGGIVPPNDRVVTQQQIRQFVPPDMLKLYDAKNPYLAFAKRIGKTPTWIFHGTEDNVVPISESRKMAEALKLEKGNMRFTEYAGEGHNISSKVFMETELWKWLLSQRHSK